MHGERALNFARLPVGPVEHRHAAKWDAGVLHEPVCFPGNRPRLLIGIVEFPDVHGRSGGSVRENVEL